VKRGVWGEFEEKMKSKLFLLIVLICINTLLNSITWHIKQDGTGNFTTIQAGIDFCADGDTLLVYPGTYFENLVIEEKYMTIGSLYLTTGDESYISQTIIDGFHNDSVIHIEDISGYYQMYIVGFIIQNGIGYQENYPYSPDRAGGGLFISESDMNIVKCIIQYNNVNHVGGGIVLSNSNLNLSGSTIRYNSAYNAAGGLLIGFISSSVNFDTDDLNSIYLNYAGVGNDIFKTHGSPYQEIIVDTFTVIDPAEGYYFIYPGSDGAGVPLPNQFSFSCQNAAVEQVNYDIYVSTNGDNNNSGISPLEPLQSIAYALVKIRSDSLMHKAIHVSDGVYSVSQNNQYFPLHIKSYVDIIGESRENTILDAELSGGFIMGQDPQRNYKIANLSLKNARNQYDVAVTQNSNALLDNILITNHIDNNNEAFKALRFDFNDVSLNNIIVVNNQFAGSVYFYSQKFGNEFSITNSIFRNNEPSITSCNQLRCYYNRIHYDSLNVNVINSEISDNIDGSTEWLPTTSAILIASETNANIVNCTIGNNETLEIGAAVQLHDESEVSIINSILYGNIPYQICLNGTWGPNILNANNSLIEGGIANILNIGNNYINWDYETMLDEDPLWLGLGAEWPYALSENSPCIDTGTLDLPYGVVLPAYDLAGNPRVCGNGIDMGAYEFPGIAAPINLEIIDATLSWQLPVGYLASGFNIYLDGEFQTTLSSMIMEYTFPDLIEGNTYIAGVSALYGTEETVIINLEFIYDPVGTEEEIPIPQIQVTNYPNPFNPETKIVFNLPEEGNVKLEIFNIKGQKVKTLLDCYMSPGRSEMIWNGKDDNGKRVSSGVYFYQFVTEKKTITKKMILIK
jgi:hypothetical protein